MREFINIILEASRSNMSLDKAVSIFQKQGVQKPLELDLTKLSAARKRLLRQQHPDVGGSDETAALINSAYDTLKDYIANGGAAHQDHASSRQSSRPSRQEEGTPTWAWAGYAGGQPPSSSIYRDSYRDYNFVKKRMWELSNHSKTEWTIQNFDGNFFRGTITVFGSPEIFHDMADAMIEWEDFHKKRAIFVSKKRSKELLLIWLDGDYVDPPIPMEHDSFNSNPGNDQSFQRRLPDVLDRISRERGTRQ